MATLATLAPIVKSFPMKEVLDALTHELMDVAQSEAQVRGITLPSAPADAVKAAVPMDSLTVVDALCVLDAIVGFQLKESIVQMGGYDSVEAALKNMIPKIEKAWLRKQGAKK
jgi:hypothetical protein